jgi:predicted component of type VI protein secretion system
LPPKYGSPSFSDEQAAYREEADERLRQIRADLERYEAGIAARRAAGGQPG